MCDEFSAICWCHRDGDRNRHCNNFTFSLVAVTASDFASIFLFSDMINHARKCIDALSINSAVRLVSVGLGWETPISAGAEPTADQRRALPHASHRCASGLLRRRAKRFFHRPKMKLSSVPRRVPCGMQKPLCPPAPPAWGKCGAPPPTANGRWGALKSTHPHGFSRSRLPLCNRPERAHQAFAPLALIKPCASPSCI